MPAKTLQEANQNRERNVFDRCDAARQCLRYSVEKAAIGCFYTTKAGSVL
jgi:hypothetical protein